MSEAFIIAARRTAVVPRGGAFKDIEVADFAAASIEAVLKDAGIAASDVEDVILGNALYGGGNPARIAALMAGIPESVPAQTLDTQCCSGTDAVITAVALIASGQADVIIAGGLESFSRSPLRFRRPKHAGEEPQAYSSPPFTPWPDRDPDMAASAASLAEANGIARAAQESFAIESHRKARLKPRPAEIVPVRGVLDDAFIRPLDAQLCARLPILAGSAAHGVTAATVAVEADAAAVLLVVSERVALKCHVARAIRILASARCGGPVTMPALAPIEAARNVLSRQGLTPGDLATTEIMEAFAVQAMAFIDGLQLDPSTVNRNGGALSRGHPIGASGAILAVRLWHELQAEAGGAIGLAAIAAAGGLGSALLMAG